MTDPYGTVRAKILDLQGSNCFSYSYSTLRINKNERKRK